MYETKESFLSSRKRLSPEEELSLCNLLYPLIPREKEVPSAQPRYQILKLRHMHLWDGKRVLFHCQQKRNLLYHCHEKDRSFYPQVIPPFQYSRIALLTCGAQGEPLHKRHNHQENH